MFSSAPVREHQQLVRELDECHGHRMVRRLVFWRTSVARKLPELEQWSARVGVVAADAVADSPLGARRRQLSPPEPRAALHRLHQPVAALVPTVELRPRCALVPCSPVIADSDVKPGTQQHSGSNLSLGTYRSCAPEPQRPVVLSSGQAQEVLGSFATRCIHVAPIPSESDSML